MKRWLLLIGINFAVMLMLGIFLTVIQVFFNVNLGKSMTGWLITSAIFGFGGSLFSLFISKWVAKWTTGAKVINPQAPQDESERWLIQIVSKQAAKMGIKTPEVAIYPGMELNAFATGPSRNNSLVAVSEGLLQRMHKDEVEAVLGHEVAHIANGDMVTMTLLQGVLNTFVIFAARIVGKIVDQAVFKNENGPGIGYFVVNIAAQFVFGLFASMIAMAFSRHREFRADEGGAYLAGKDKMIAALHRLKLDSESAEAELPKAIQAFGINGRFSSLFSSHPPLEKRIETLRNRQIV